MHTASVEKTTLSTDGLTQSGYYIRDCEDQNDKTPLRVKFTAAADPSAPLVILTHGYRGQYMGKDTSSERLAEKLLNIGFSVAQVGHSNCDYVLEDEADSFTNQTQEQDLTDVINAAGSRDVVLCANSGSINYVLPAGAKHRNVKRIFAFSSFPDLPNFMQSIRDQFDVQFPACGFLDGFGEFTERVTETYVNAGQDLSLYDAHALSQLEHKPPMTIVRYSDDKIAKHSNVPQFLTAVGGAGFAFNEHLLAGGEHRLTDEMLDVCEQEFQTIYNDLRAA